MKSGLAALYGALSQCIFVDGEGNKKGEAQLTPKELAKANRELENEGVEHRWVPSAPATPSQYDAELEAMNSYVWGE